MESQDNLIKLQEEYYLVGSLREDAKIRYWHTSSLDQPWRNYYDNVLLPQGNYAGRICRDDSGFLLWNFFTEKVADRTSNNLMPPPKRLHVDGDGQLRAATYEQFDQRVIGLLNCRCLRPLKDNRSESQQFCQTDCSTLRIASEAGFQAYVFEEDIDSFCMTAKLSMAGVGKCGLICRVDGESHDGYYFSLDLLKGLVQLRAWGTGPLRSGEHMMQFKSLQTGNWYDSGPRELRIKLLAFGSYIELSINGNVILSLANDSFTRGLLGFYVETAELLVEDLQVQRLAPPTQTDEHLATG